MRQLRLQHIIFFLLFWLSGASYLYAQKEKDLDKILPTEKVGFDIKVDKKDDRPKRENLKYIIKNSTNGIFYGNPCALTVTRKMGFEYAVQTKGMQGSMSDFSRFFHNFWVKTGLFFKHSPFWKIRLKKKLRECGLKSGDRVG